MSARGRFGVDERAQPSEIGVLLMVAVTVLGGAAVLMMAMDIALAEGLRDAAEAILDGDTNVNEVLVFAAAGRSRLE